MKYLVTGGTGFIGSAIVRRLVQEGHTVRVMDNNLRGVPERLADVATRIELLNGDIREAAAVADACRGMDCVLHLAYLNGTEYFYTHPDLVLEIGVKGMLNVLDGCQAHGVRRLVLASSSEAYQTPPTIPTPEDVPLVVPDVLNPRYSYGGGKIISELLVFAYAKHFDWVTVFRPHNVYGPDMGWQHVLPQFCVRMKDATDATPAPAPVPFPIQGDGTETRAFVYIDDFTDGLMCILNRGEHRNVYHIGTQEEVSIGHIAERLGRVGFNREVLLHPGEAPKGAVNRRCPDITKLRSLGYEPNITLDEGLRRTAEWYTANRHLKPDGMGGR
jgi:nucleoside-diphosphate-sugar epimerase